MIYKDNPTDEDLMNCDDFEMCSLSEHNSCIYRRKCEELQFRKLNNELEDVFDNLQSILEQGAKTNLMKGL